VKKLPNLLKNRPKDALIKRLIKVKNPKELFTQMSKKGGVSVLFIDTPKKIRRNFAQSGHPGQTTASDQCCFIYVRNLQNKVVLNDRRSGVWGLEEYLPIIIMNEEGATKAFNQGHTVQVLIKCELGYLQVSLVDSDAMFCLFSRRLSACVSTRLLCYQAETNNF
jgi:hypothetical protein